MKKLLLFFAAVVSVALTGCTSEEILQQEKPQTTEALTDAIVFGGTAPAMTRANHYGSDAATRLGNTFVVYGTKHTEAEDATDANDAVVFNNFQVKFTASSAGTTDSNTSDWDYLGLQAYGASPTSQGIKYWDYGATNGHTFYAFSSSDISYPKDATEDKVQVTKVTADTPAAPATGSLYNKGYQVTVKSDANLDNLYFSDRVVVPKTDYKKTVSFTFRNICSKVRFGFYETIPGYNVKIDRFYIDADADPDATPATAPVTSFAAMKDEKTDGFYASLQNVKMATGQTINVTYNDNSDLLKENQPKVSNPTGGYDYTLKLGTATTIINQTLGTTASNPTWVVEAGAYTPVYPFEGNVNPLLVKLDFTMTADDGSSDVIHVKGARAIIPAQYVQWKGNFAYTYIFKISDLTNGTTGNTDDNGDPTDPEGLHPITFDAIVVDITEERQETISSVSTNSITTYAEGAVTDEYKAGTPVYVAVTNNTATDHAVITPEAIGTAAGNAQVYKLDNPASEAEVFAKLTGSPIGITMTPVTASIEPTVPLADGTTASIPNVKFTPTADGTYAYVYTRTAYVAPTYAAASGTYDSTMTYYMKSGSGAYYAVSVASEAAFDANKAQFYTRTADGTPGEYDIKVIKVKE